MKIFWAFFHSIMFIILAAICMFSEIANAGKEILDNERYSNDKKEYYFGERIMMMSIIFAVIFTFLFFVLYIAVKNQTVAIWFCGVAGIAYAYIGGKQIIKMIFIPLKKAFSSSDISDFLNTYMVWWLIVLAVTSVEIEGSIFEKIMPTYWEVIKVGMFFIWYYFNILFVLGGLYILLYYLWKAVKRVATKFDFKGRKIKNIANRICDLWKREEKYAGLKSFRLWREGNRKGVVYKIFMTIPLLIFDICGVVCLFAKYCVRMTLSNAIKIIFELIRVLYKYAKNLWNRHENNEWIYLFAQIAGPFSYVIVFLIIQYGEYEEVTKRIYEFIGTIILIPFFLRKIENVNKNLKDNEAKVNVEGEKGEANLKNMIYNEIEEAAIDKKTN